MTYNCGFCLQKFVFANGSYSYIHSNIVLHIDSCETAARFTRVERNDAVERSTERVFVLPSFRLAGPGDHSRS